MASDDNPKNIVQSVGKVFSVLRAFDANLPELTVSEVAARAGLDRGTSFRLVNTLCQLGYLATVPRSRRYRMTLKCLELGYTALARADLKMLARPLLNEIVPDFADAASLGMLDDVDVVYVERIQMGPALSVDRRPGSRTGAYAAALGHAILAYLPEAKSEDLIRRSHRVKLSERTLTDIDELMNRFALVRQRGYAVSDGENAYGLRTVAAPVLDAERQAVAGISATVSADRMSLETFVTTVGPEVRRIADELSRAITLTFGSVAEARR